MQKMDRHIEIVSSTLPGLSSMGPSSRQGILKVLSEHYQHVRISIVNDIADLEALVKRQPDVVFLGMKFLPADPLKGQYDPEKIWITKYLDANGITHTGSSHRAHTYEQNKTYAKTQVRKHGFATAPFTIAERGNTFNGVPSELNFPLFVKPVDRGGGEGIDSDSVVYTDRQLQQKVASIHLQLKTDALVEEYLPGREFSVALLRHSDASDLYVMPLELIAPVDNHGHRVLSSRVKSADTERAIAVTDPGIHRVISRLAEQVFDCLEGQDYGRIDIRLDRRGNAQFLEANLLPSLLEGYGNFPKACMLNEDIDYQTMALHITELAFERGQQSALPVNWQPETLLPPVLVTA